MKKRKNIQYLSGKNSRMILSAVTPLLLFSLSACSSVKKNDTEKVLTEEAKWEKSIRSSYSKWEPEKRKQDTVFEDVPSYENTDIPAQTNTVVPVMPSPAQSSATAKKLPSAVHTVVKGETLWGIARKYYGSGIHWNMIAEANTERLKKGTVINPGLVLVIPSVTAENEIAVSGENDPVAAGIERKDMKTPDKQTEKIENKETIDSGTGKKK